MSEKVITSGLTSLGANGRPVVRNNAKKKEVDNHFTRFRRSLHDPYEACFRSFFVDGQPPIGLRKNLHNIRYICQQVPRSREVFYGTMFDEDIGLAVYSAYTLTQQTVNFGQVQGARGWRQEPGISLRTAERYFIWEGRLENKRRKCERPWGFWEHVP